MLVGVMKRIEMEPYYGQANKRLRVLQKIELVSSLLRLSYGLFLPCVGAVLPFQHEPAASCAWGEHVRIVMSVPESHPASCLLRPCLL